jgi:Glycosyltransferase family 87
MTLNVNPLRVTALLFLGLRTRSLHSCHSFCLAGPQCGDVSNFCLFILLSFQAIRDLSMMLIAAVGVLSFFPFVETLYEGQVGCLILFLWTVGFYCARTRRIAVSAARFAIGTAVRLTPAIVVPIFILRRQWKGLISYVATLSALLLFSIWRVGWQAHHFYVTQSAAVFVCGHRRIFAQVARDRGAEHLLEAGHIRTIGLMGTASVSESDDQGVQRRSIWRRASLPVESTEVRRGGAGARVGDRGADQLLISPLT